MKSHAELREQMAASAQVSSEPLYFRPCLYMPCR